MDRRSASDDEDSPVKTQNSTGKSWPPSMDELDRGAVEATGDNRDWQMRTQMPSGIHGGQKQVGTQVQDCPRQQGGERRYGEKGKQEYDATGSSRRNPEECGVPVRSPERDPG